MFGYKIMRDDMRNRPYRVGLALSGGGARGVAHAGVIKAMLEVGLVPDIVAGVSAGSVAAAMYGAGMTPEEMLQLFKQSNFRDFCKLTVPGEGLLNMDGFRRMLRRKILYRNIEDLPKPVVITATDLDHGIRAAFEEGDIATRVSASCSIPVVFKPVKINGVRYVDGGVLDNMPAWAIRSRCRFLVGVNCSPVSNPKKPKSNIISIALRSYELMMKNNSMADQQMCDMLITTDDIADYGVFDLQDLDRVFNSGYTQTMAYFRAHGIEPKP